MTGKRQGLVLGVYEADKGVTLTPATKTFQQNKATNLTDLINVSGLADKKGKCRVFYNLDSQFSSVAVVSLGKRGVGFNAMEQVDESKENIRAGVAAGVKQLQEQGVTSVTVDPCGDPEAAGEGASLSVWYYDELKAADKKKPPPQLQVYAEGADDADSVKAAWTRGVTLGEGQNLSRRLMETPANHMTPTRFSEIAQELMGLVEKTQVNVRDRKWAESMKMFSFLSVANGSDEPPKFLEVHYNGGANGAAPLAVVGKGITFDSGGISIKPSANMDEMRADMGGAACTLASVYTAARLKLPINIVALMALSENMPNGKATKPGDVVTAMNGKTIQIDNTDAEGRLVLADALCYAETFKPRGIIDMATLTGAMVVALGAASSGVFTNSEMFWENMLKASTVSGDRVWRMPLFKHYLKKMSESPLADLVNTAGRPGGACNAAAFLKAGQRSGDRVWRLPLFKLYTEQISDTLLADLNNIGNTRAGGSCTAVAFLKLYTEQISDTLLADLNNIGNMRAGVSCTAAAFLKEFVTNEHWMHLDIAGVMSNKSEVPYLPKGMSGRPTRTIVEFMNRLSKQ